MLHRLALGLIILVAMTSAARSATAEAPPMPGHPPSLSLERGLRRLGVVGSVLYLGAHPDDENRALLTFLSKEMLLRTAFLSLTRGDGGHRPDSTERGEDAGVLRTQELLAARRADGAVQYFTRARDFGYTRSADETLRVWGRAAILADVVGVIRHFRPDVIITRFSPELPDAHGHHTAAGRLALEAFHAAADPGYRPGPPGQELAPWQARRILWNRSASSLRADEDVSDLIRLEVDAGEPGLGQSYAELTGDGAGGSRPPAGETGKRANAVEHFKLLSEANGALPASSVFEGLSLSWARWKGTAGFRRLLARVERELDRERPEQIIPGLVQVDRALEEMPDPHWREIKRAEVRDLVLACTGLDAQVTAADFRAVPGTTLAVGARVRNPSSARVHLHDVRFFAGSRSLPAEGDPPSLPAPLGFLETKQSVRLPADVPLTSPAWLALPPEPGRYQPAGRSSIAPAEPQASLRAELAIEVGGRVFVAERPVVFEWTELGVGELRRPVEITPAVSVRPREPVLLLPNRMARPVTVELKSAVAGAAGVLRVNTPPGWKVSPASSRFSLARPGDETSLSFRIEPPLAAGPASTTTLELVAEVGANRFTNAVRHVGRPPLLPEPVVEPAKVRAQIFPLATQATRVACLPRPGDEVPAALRQAGYEVTVLDEETLSALRPGSPVLARFDAVTGGVRAFHESEKVRAAHPALLAYVQGGGTLVIHNDASGRLAPSPSPLGPFPFDVARGRVAEERATVILSMPSHRLLSSPNQITGRDFDDWVEERGLHFASSWDPRYQVVLRTSDPGERTQDGALLWARHGRGAFIYTGLSFHRQLPAGVPGAYRLFANLLAAGKPRTAR